MRVLLPFFLLLTLSIACSESGTNQGTTNVGNTVSTPSNPSTPTTSSAIIVGQLNGSESEITIPLEIFGESASDMEGMSVSFYKNETPYKTDLSAISLYDESLSAAQETIDGVQSEDTIDIYIITPEGKATIYRGYVSAEEDTYAFLYGITDTGYSSFLTLASHLSLTSFAIAKNILSQDSDATLVGKQITVPCDLGGSIETQYRIDLEDTDDGAAIFTFMNCMKEEELTASDGVCTIATTIHGVLEATITRAEISKFRIKSVELKNSEALEIEVNDEPHLAMLDITFNNESGTRTGTTLSDYSGTVTIDDVSYEMALLEEILATTPTSEMCPEE